MIFSTRRDGDSAFLRIEGELDALTVSDLRATLDELAAEGNKRIVVDLSALRLIDSSGVGALVSLYKRVTAQGGTMVIEGAHDQPLAIFRLLKLDRVLMG